MKVLVSIVTRPPAVVLTPTRAAAEPLVLWNRADVWDLIIDLNDAYRKAWPDVGQQKS